MANRRANGSFILSFFLTDPLMSPLSTYVKASWSGDDRSTYVRVLVQLPWSHLLLGQLLSRHKSLDAHHMWYGPRPPFSSSSFSFFFLRPRLDCSGTRPPQYLAGPDDLPPRRNPNPHPSPKISSSPPSATPRLAASSPSPARFWPSL
jgi:hypothetical protein